MNNDPEKSHRIDEIEQKLYSPNPNLDVKDRKPLRPKEYGVQDDWERTETVVEDKEIFIPDKKPNWFLRFFIITFIFFIGALGYAGYVFFFATSSISRNIDILVNAPLTIGAAEPFRFEVLVQNKDHFPIVFVDVIVEFPDGSRRVDNIQELYRRDVQQIEVVPSGATVKKDYEVFLFGEENESKDIKVTLVYQTEESTSFFEKQKNFDVVLRSTPIRMTINSVSETTSGQDLVFNIELVSNSTQTLENILIEAFYPFGFTFKESNIDPREDKRSWIVSSLQPREVKTLTIRGTIEGQNNDDKFFRFVTGLEPDNPNDPVIAFNTQGKTIRITRPFLEIGLSVDRNNEPVLVLDPERGYTANITLNNNAGAPIRNAEIVMNIAGNVLHKDRIFVSEGFYQSVTDTVTWDWSTSNKLVQIPIGRAEQLSFSFTGKGVGTDPLILNPEAILTINVKANRNPEGAVADFLENTLVRTIKFNTQAQVQSRSEFFSNIFENSGPVPPKVETQTFYTATLQVLNSTNNIRDGVVTMRVPNYVQYAGAHAPSEENVSYDATARTITWRLGNIDSFTGYQGNPPRRIHLQVGIIPSVSQAGTVPDLINNIQFVGTDTHTGTRITRTAPSITTSIADSTDFYQAQVTR